MMSLRSMVRAIGATESKLKPPRRPRAEPPRLDRATYCHRRHTAVHHAARWWRIGCVGMILALLSLAPSGARAASVGHFRLALSTPPRLQGIGSGVSYVVLQPWEQAEARRLRQRDPGLKVLVYQDFGSMTAGLGPDAQSSSGVPFRTATRQHPDWFLADGRGRRIQERGYPYLFMADVGNPGYRRRWTTDVLHLLRHGPWSGVFMDDVNTTPRPEAGSAVIAG